MLGGAAHGGVQVPAAKGSRGTKIVDTNRAGEPIGQAWAQVVVVVVFALLMLVVVTYRFVDILLSALDEALASSKWMFFPGRGLDALELSAAATAVVRSG